MKAIILILSIAFVGCKKECYLYKISYNPGHTIVTNFISMPGLGMEKQALAQSPHANEPQAKAEYYCTCKEWDNNGKLGN